MVFILGGFIWMAGPGEPGCLEDNHYWTPLLMKGHRCTVDSNSNDTAVTEDTRETVFLFQRLSIALQRGNAVAFLATFDAV